MLDVDWSGMVVIGICLFWFLIGIVYVDAYFEQYRREKRKEKNEGH